MKVQMMREIGATNYVECSALSSKGLRKVFNEVIITALSPKINLKCTKQNCVIL